MMLRKIGMDLDQLEIIAGEFLLDPLLVASFICVESSGNPWAWNPEPQYRYLWDVKNGKPFRPLTVAERASKVPPADFPSPPRADRDAEYWGQSCSWGLMQVMGAVAREHNFKEIFLSQLCQPDLNVWVGCKHLAGKIRRYPELTDAISAYNAGSPRRAASGQYENQVYVDRVTAQLGRLKDGSDELEGQAP